MGITRRTVCTVVVAAFVTPEMLKVRLRLSGVNESSHFSVTMGDVSHSLTVNCMVTLAEVLVTMVYLVGKDDVHV